MMVENLSLPSSMPMREGLCGNRDEDVVAVGSCGLRLQGGRDDAAEGGRRPMATLP